MGFGSLYYAYETGGVANLLINTNTVKLAYKLSLRGNSGTRKEGRRFTTHSSAHNNDNDKLL